MVSRIPQTGRRDRPDCQTTSCEHKRRSGFQQFRCPAETNKHSDLMSCAIFASVSFDRSAIGGRIAEITAIRPSACFRPAAARFLFRVVQRPEPNFITTVRRIGDEQHRTPIFTNKGDTVQRRVVRIDTAIFYWSWDHVFEFRRPALRLAFSFPNSFWSRRRAIPLRLSRHRKSIAPELRTR